jgi:hypothetical protein
VTARELGEISLAEALELVCLIALKDPRRHGRAGARWLRRFLEQSPGAGLDDVAFVTGCLSALGGREHEAARAALRSLTDHAAQGHLARTRKTAAPHRLTDGA